MEYFGKLHQKNMVVTRVPVGECEGEREEWLYLCFFEMKKKKKKNKIRGGDGSAKRERDIVRMSGGEHVGLKKSNPFY